MLPEDRLNGAAQGVREWG